MSVHFKSLGIFVILFFLFGFVADKDDPIYLENPSFEDEPQDATVPYGWDACGFISTPDILPGFWGVDLEASEGDSYIGLITRDNKTNEYIGQKLSQPLLKNTCYQFSIDLAHSSEYAGFSSASVLKIYGGSIKCFKEELLFKSDLVSHEDWETYSIAFTPKKKYKYIIIEIAHDNIEEPRNGNLLLDNCSTIEKCTKA